MSKSWKAGPQQRELVQSDVVFGEALLGLRLESSGQLWGWRDTGIMETYQAWSVHLSELQVPCGAETK